jgi:hypothetical protein
MAWHEIPGTELAAWNERLLHEPSASIRQYPFLNEALRGSGGLWVSIPGRFAPLIALGRRWTTTPRYLSYRFADGRASFVCIVTIGVPGLRFGCVLDGPVALQGCSIEPTVIEELVRWARRNHYVALRVTHSDPAFLGALARVACADRMNGVPFFPYPASELYVELTADEATLLSRFQKVARQEIRKAREAGYVISVNHEPEALERAWPAFQSRSARKGISYRDIGTYLRIMREAEPSRAAHLFTAWRGERPVAAILILRDCTTAHYFLGAVDTDALGDAPSPACLLHLSAMQHAIGLGATSYNLGTRSGSVYAFKAKFRPTEREYPGPLSLGARPWLYGAWRKAVPAVARVSY